MPKLISIIGFPRSGTTWLGRALGQLENVQYMEEPVGIWYRVFKHNMSDLSVGIRKNENKEKWLKRYWDEKSDIIIEKTPTNILRVKHLKEFIPDMKFIILVRDPLVASSSVVDKWERGIDRNHVRLSRPNERIGSATHTLKARIRKAAQIGRLDALWEQRDKAWQTIISFLQARPVPLEHAIRIPGMANLRQRLSNHDFALWSWITAHSLLLAEISNIPKEDRAIVEYEKLYNRDPGAWKAIGEIIGSSINTIMQSKIISKEPVNAREINRGEFSENLIDIAYYVHNKII